MATTAAPNAKKAKKTKRARGSEKSMRDAVRHRKKNTPEIKDLAPSEFKELCRQCKIGRTGGKELRRRVTGTLELFLHTMNKGVDLYAYSRGRSTATSQDVDRAYKHYYGRRLYGLGDEAEFQSPSKRRKVSKKSREKSGVDITKEPGVEDAEDAEAAAAEPHTPTPAQDEPSSVSEAAQGEKAPEEQEEAEEAGEDEEAAVAASSPVPSSASSEPETSV